MQLMFEGHSPGDTQTAQTMSLSSQVARLLVNRSIFLREESGERNLLSVTTTVGPVWYSPELDWCRRNTKSPSGTKISILRN